MASGKTCATLIKGLLRVRLAKTSAAPASTSCKQHTRPAQRSPALSFASTALCTAGRPLKVTNWVPLMQRARFYTKWRGAPPPQRPLEPSLKHGDDDDEKEEEEDNHSFLFGKYDNNYSDDDDEDFFMPNLFSTDDDDNHNP